MKKVLQLILTSLLVFAFMGGYTQNYTNLSVDIPSMTRSDIATGDYDNDGDLDMVIGGMIDNYDAATYLFENQEGEFVQSEQEFPSISDGDAVFGDYDADGDLDLLLTGNGNSEPFTGLYENEDGIFSEVETNIESMGGNTSAAFGDYDRDGDLDLAVVGFDQSYIYNNDDGTFVDTQTEMPGLDYAATEWVDFDNDGDLDLMMAGEDGSMPNTLVYENVEGQFEELDLAFQDIMSGDIDWGDYDNDGDMDLAVVGYDQYLEGQTVIYRNDGNNTFKNIGAAVLGLSNSSAEWGDADNDGDLDLLVSGSCDDCSVLLTTVLKNDEGVFSDSFPGFENTERGEARFVDYDNDGDSDVLVAGQDIGGTLVTNLYRNNDHDNQYHTNAAPDQPAGLSASPAGDEVMLSWNAASDDYTPVSSLSYNLRVGSTSGGSEVIVPMCNPSTGSLLKPRMGNVNQALTWRLEDLQPGTYYWSIQTVDNMYHTSDFTTEQSFTITSTQVENPASSKTISVYPNPVKGQATLVFEKQKYHTLKILDVNGKVYHTKTITSRKEHLDFSGYSKGVYVVRLIGETENRLKKILVR
ncbi:MAG: FG-GAP-like repeat-containing protein [Bacteroidales bacterium]|nr:FG-GAP-like repeat-containing protein [Bacteroidales bacterium]MCF8333522.1 FG-GAP-like repeat-containing protein [Bacteroidales bacterium]